MFGLILNNFKQFFFVESNYNIHFLPALDIWFFFLWVGLLHNKMSCLKSVMIKFGHFKCEEKMLLWSLNTILMVKKKTTSEIRKESSNDSNSNIERNW